MAKMYRVYSVIARPRQEDFWLNIGIAYAHENGDGFNVMLQALPLNLIRLRGRLALPELPALGLELLEPRWPLRSRRLLLAWKVLRLAGVAFGGRGGRPELHGRIGIDFWFFRSPRINFVPSPVSRKYQSGGRPS